MSEPGHETAEEAESKYATKNFHYFRDHEQSGAWGVREVASTDRASRTVAIGMDKTEALALALLLDGKTDVAAEVVARYQEMTRNFSDWGLKTR